MTMHYEYSDFKEVEEQKLAKFLNINGVALAKILRKPEFHHLKWYYKQNPKLRCQKDRVFLNMSNKDIFKIIKLIKHKIN